MADRYVRVTKTWLGVVEEETADTITITLDDGTLRSYTWAKSEVTITEETAPLPGWWPAQEGDLLTNVNTGKEWFIITNPNTGTLLAVSDEGNKFDVALAETDARTRNITLLRRRS